MGTVLKGMGTASYVAAKAVMIVGAGLFALGAAGSIKEKLWPGSETDETTETLETEAVEEN